MRELSVCAAKQLLTYLNNVTFLFYGQNLTLNAIMFAYKKTDLSSSYLHNYLELTNSTMAEY